VFNAAHCHENVWGSGRIDSGISNLPLDGGESFIFLAPGKQPPVLNRRLGGPQSEPGHSRDEKCLCCYEE